MNLNLNMIERHTQTGLIYLLQTYSFYFSKFKIMQSHILAYTKII